MMKLTPEEYDALTGIDFWTFVQRVFAELTGEPFQDNFHIQKLCAEVDRIPTVRGGEGRRPPPKKEKNGEGVTEDRRGETERDIRIIYIFYIYLAISLASCVVSRYGIFFEVS